MSASAYLQTITADVENATGNMYLSVNHIFSPNTERQALLSCFGYEYRTLRVLRE
jgi:hypothetical protein